jgi:hypothetical protein
MSQFSHSFLTLGFPSHKTTLTGFLARIAEVVVLRGTISGIVGVETNVIKVSDSALISIQFREIQGTRGNNTADVRVSALVRDNG